MDEARVGVRRLAVRLALLALIGLSLGCSSWENVPHTYPTNAGGDVPHGRWTRSDRVYENFETVALLSATLLSPRFEAELSGLLEREVPGRTSADLLGFGLPQTRAAAVVIVTGRSRGFETFGARESAWSVSMETRSGLVAPMEHHRLDPAEAFERYFSAWNPWSRAWLLSFPASSGELTGPVELRFRAPGGVEADLRWP